jgi:hypothetical protein
MGRPKKLEGDALRLDLLWTLWKAFMGHCLELLQSEEPASAAHMDVIRRALDDNGTRCDARTMQDRLARNAGVNTAPGSLPYPLGLVITDKGTH